ncbi:MAG: response regulator transcription factor [Bacilli bacterium]|jgi:DNA-binding response OmpR family regulator|nr:response regulator transcription factor [Bacilli bacterium]
MNKTLLFIDDDKIYSEILTGVLRKNGFIVECVNTVNNIKEIIESSSYDIYLIDYYLDNLRGTQLGEYILMYNREAVIVYISHSEDPKVELACLEMGGIEHIRKDQSFEVILKRLEKIFDKPMTSIYQYKDLSIDLKNFVVRKNDMIVKLTNIEFKLLKILVENRNESLPRDYIAENIWGYDYDSYLGELRTIDTHVKNLKKKLEINNIQAVRGVGYRWYER